MEVHPFIPAVPCNGLHSGTVSVFTPPPLKYIYKPVYEEAPSKSSRSVSFLNDAHGFGYHGAYETSLERTTERGTQTSCRTRVVVR